jgi:hypothetical protein
MKFPYAKRLWSSYIIFTSMLLVTVTLLSSGCSKKSEPVSTVPPVSPEQAMANKIKSVENDPRMPADVKAKEIARIKTESLQNR